MTLIALSIRDFALPVPRTGSIDAYSGYGRAPAEGQEIHLRVQARRAESSAAYQAEVPLVQELEHEGYRFRVGGRMDGFFDTDPPRIEEIKSSFNIHELAKRLEENPDDHPYCLQLKTYGYFYWLQHQVIPQLSFHLVSSRNGEADDLDVKLDVERYESWLRRRLEELAEEARKCEKRSARRRKIARDFPFPFEKPRPGQIELIAAVEKGMEARQRLLVQAPTGLGKTAGVLYPALKEALSRGQRVVYVTPKNSQHSVAEDAIARFQDTGSKVKSLTLTAKSKICFKNEPLCNPQYCEFARDHYTKVYANGVLDLLGRKKKLRKKSFQDVAEEFQVCPFELQLDAAADVDTVICDYNYVFAPRVAFGRLNANGIGQDGKPNLVIDEAHNLPSRAMDYYSPALSSVALEKMRDDLRALPVRFRAEAEGLLDDCLQVILSCRPAGLEGARSTRIEPPVAPFLEQDAGLRAFLSRYLDSDVEIRPRDVVLRLCFYWSAFTDALGYVTDPEHTEFFTTFQTHPTGGTVRITCCDASEMLEACYDEYENVVGFSATLKPFDFYAKLSGLDPETLRTEEFASPFPRERRKLLIIPQISTKYSERERNYPRIAETIERIAALKPGNYFAFFPSFDFLERVLAVFRPPEGFTALKQEREMKAARIEEILDYLRERVAPTVVFAVQGGVFSEGVDYPGETLIGAFVVGPPLPNFDLEREQMRDYYQKHYGSGFEYAYAFPAMAKAVQAAGRVIRSETDRGLIVLMDNRFLQPSYAGSMPADWFDENPRELVSASILKEVAEFWD
ncbi:MAG: ATP-dependent DNA helicase [Oligoflexia bacterium]|nr:ATP-dependent DNA helicase [Oligoflexia bacterium]